MKVKFVLIMLVMLALVAGCSDELGSGKSYPALDKGDAVVVYKIDKVIQNKLDIKSFMPGVFDNVELTLSYKDSKPFKLTLAETGAPFRITSYNYADKLEFEWTINTLTTPYKIMNKETGELFCYISRDYRISFPFSLGCPSNTYEYQLIPVSE